MAALASRREPRSLFGEILDWMLAPLLLLWPMSLALTWLVAQTIANRPYDRELGDRVEALARQATTLTATPRPANAALRNELERSARVLLRSEDEDEQFFFQVLGRRGELLAGESRLTVPFEDGLSSDGVRYRDDVVGEEPVRVAYLWLAVSGGRALGVNDRDALVQVAETLGKRSRLATEIVKGVILPQFVILPLAVVLVWFGLSRGFRPLAELQHRIRQRETHDLSPIPEGDVPDEVAPLVRAINELLQRLDHSMAAQRHFLADAAHQLKTPLAGLRTQAELAAREIDSGRGDPATMKHSLRQIALSSQRAAHMVNQLLAMARAEDQGMAVRRQPVDLPAVVRAAVRDFVPRALERRIDLGYEGPAAPRAQRRSAPLAEAVDAAGAVIAATAASAATAEAPPAAARLLGEPVLIGELVRNLIDNALNYTPAGGTVTARVVPDPRGQEVVLQVEDTGPGITPAERALVFKAFYRTLGTEVDGSGLGLAIVQEVAQRHGAEVSIEDAQPRVGPNAAAPGALFTVRFPLTPAAEALQP